MNKLSKCSGIVFFPMARETFCRLVVEAKCLGLDVITSKNYGASMEEWFDELEGKILIREINVYSHQSIDAFYDEEETNFEPCSVYFGLAYNFNGVTFNDEEDEFENDELEEYVPRDGEVAEQYFEYFLITLLNKLLLSISIAFVAASTASL